MHSPDEEIQQQRDACLARLDALKRLFPGVVGFAVEEPRGSTQVHVVARLSLRVIDPVKRQEIMNAVVDRFEGAQHVLAEPRPRKVVTTVEPHSTAIFFASWEKLDNAVAAIERMYPVQGHGSADADWEKFVTAKGASTPQR